MARQVRPSELCRHPDCVTSLHKDGHVGPKRSTYGWPGGRAERCAEHAEEGMVGMGYKHCEFPGCTKRASHSVPGGATQRCGEHKLPGHVDLRSRTRCIIPGCGLNASFGLPGGKRLHCFTHMAEGEVRLAGRVCIVEGCTSKPRFGPSSPGEPIHCKTHRAVGDVELVLAGPLCELEGCQKYGSFAPPGAGRRGPLRCKEHSPPGWTHGGKAAPPPSAAMARPGLLRLPRPPMQAARTLLPFLLRCM
jgi:EsV-1-7 cysteine-rich motif